MNNLYGMIFRRSLFKEENKMIHMDYMLKNEYSIYSLDYIFFQVQDIQKSFRCPLHHTAGMF